MLAVFRTMLYRQGITEFRKPDQRSAIELPVKWK